MLEHTVSAAADAGREEDVCNLMHWQGKRSHNNDDDDDDVMMIFTTTTTTTTITAITLVIASSIPLLSRQLVHDITLPPS